MSASNIIQDTISVNAKSKHNVEKYKKGIQVNGEVKSGKKNQQIQINHLYK